MTRREAINNYLPYPMNEMVMRNAEREHSMSWLSDTTHEFNYFGHSECKMYRILNYAFTWEYSPEGDDFWRDIYTNFCNKDL
jgi:hypothetical protein